MKRLIILSIVLLAIPLLPAAAQEDYILVWHDEFDNEGEPNPENWNFEEGFLRYHEKQWYQPQNAWCRNGILTITAKKEEKPNPDFNSKSKDWGRQRHNISITSASLTTKGKREFTYGRFEVRARIPVTPGCWPAIWLKGSKYPWPSCGEIDMMEYYPYKGTPSLLANVCWAGEEDKSIWDTSAKDFNEYLKRDSLWASRFHIWRMDWDSRHIRLFLDDELMNETSILQTINAPTSQGADDNPFENPLYIMLKLAMGSVGGEIDESTLPAHYEIDYVRVYQKL